MCLGVENLSMVWIRQKYDLYGHENKIFNTTMINKFTTKLKSWKYFLTKSKCFFIFPREFKNVLIFIKIDALKISMLCTHMVLTLTEPHLLRCLTIKGLLMLQVKRQIKASLTYGSFYSNWLCAFEVAQAFNWTLTSHMIAYPHKSHINKCTQTKKFAKLELTINYTFV